MQFISKTALNIEGTFVIPPYQRGYRWGESEVTRLLDDIEERYKSRLNVCLQPIVVKSLSNSENIYELIDGQQRLTTIYLILKAIQKHKPTISSPFKLKYSTRNSTEEYLSELSDTDKNKNIDFRHIHDAYCCILRWLGDNNNLAVAKSDLLFNMLFEHVQMLWYEVDEDEDGRELFARLNIGKIALTNAELVKALFLNRGVQSNEAPSYIQKQIAVQWDMLERELRNESLWAFLTNENSEEFDTRLDLLFDFFTHDRTHKKDKYSIFFELNRRLWDKNGEYRGSTEKLWRDIYEFFLQMKQWYNNVDLYHRAGYIVAVQNKTPIFKLISDTEEYGLTDKLVYLDSEIKRIVDIGSNEIDEINCRLNELDYRSDRNLIEKILLLFNVRTTALHSRFPFDKYKNKKHGWSLEHIHAQHSEGLNKREQWETWLNQNKESLKALKENEKAEILFNQITNYPKESLSQAVFDKFQKEVTELLTIDKMGDEELHSISNLALIGRNDNALLNNSLFETKRQKIIELDSSGEYIPVCTRNVFLKYYSPAGANHPHFWGRDDRSAYFRQIVKIVYKIKE